MNSQLKMVLGSINMFSDSLELNESNENGIVAVELMMFKVDKRNCTLYLLTATLFCLYSSLQ